MSSWINTEIEMPPLDLLVEVRGDHTPEGWGYLKAYLRDYGNGEINWSSTEWRGTVGIREWRRIRSNK